jgi:hypothetical protein
MDIAGAPNNRWKTASDHIFDFTWSGYKIIPNMWSELAEVSLAAPSKSKLPSTTKTFFNYYLYSRRLEQGKPF